MIRGRTTIGVLAAAGLAMWAVRQAPRPIEAPQETEPARESESAPFVAPPPAPRRRSWRRRAATALVYTTLFFAGGAVVAGAGNELAQVDPGSTDAAAVTDVASTDAASTDVTTTVESTDDTTAEETATSDDTSTVPTPTTTEASENSSDAVVETPDPTDAKPPVAADAGAPAPAPVEHAPATARHVAAQPTAQPANAHDTAAPVAPFPVLAFDPQAWLVNHPGTPAGDAAVAIAERYLGVPYRWGGGAPSTGFDCSGLTQYVYAQLGVWLPHYAAAQFLAYPRVDPSRLEAGDLVFFEPKPDGPGHVAIYAGGDTIVEAPHTGAVVRIASLSGAATALGFLGAVRPSAGSATVPTLEPFALVTVESRPANWLVRAT